MRVIRAILSVLILFFDWLFTPKGVNRTSDDQQAVDKACESLTLYQFRACPFCVKVRRQMKRQRLNIETRDAKRSEHFAEELLKGGGRIKVPCLKIVATDGDVQWMYESSDIIAYLQQRFAD